MNGTTNRARIVLVTPHVGATPTGNRVTAERWARFLGELGHDARVVAEWGGEACDVLVALHASKSAASVEAFRARHPRGRVVVVLTGTDVYGGMERDPAARATLARADRLVVLQPRALRALPAELRAKARVVRQSAERPPFVEMQAADAFEVAVVGHLRAVKDPMLAARAARRLPSGSRLCLLHAGAALDVAIGAEAREEMQSNLRYRWLGELAHDDARRLIARSRLLVLTSRSEGGANVVSEAIACGVPVLSTRIDGSLGILGESYPGYFEVGDEAALARLLDRCERDARFLDGLRRWCARLAPTFAPEREREARRRLVEELVGGVGVADRRERASAIVVESEPEFIRLADSVARGLERSPKAYECCWFYDEAGSRLFEEICALPEYYLTRAEDEILRAHAAELVARLPRGVALAELGSGSATKTRHLIEPLLARDGCLDYATVDISESALEDSARELLARHPGLAMTTICAEYDDGLALLARSTRAPRLVLWLGSNIGNFHRPDAAAFLSRLRAELAPGDHLLLGADLRKDRARLEAAYDDAAGVTARFNLNLLERIDRELGSDFDAARFDHRAVYEEVEGRIAMWLVNRERRTVRIPLLDRTVELAAGEAVHTEYSYKHSVEELDALARDSGFRVAARWFDRERLFADTLLVVEDA
ncbi:MAG: TIGR04348 family glycosyltransferase [Planctomycetes bacterium]|nr:TIGR04348 family glycosyltransferase [Planctomycetota bacterium]